MILVHVDDFCKRRRFKLHFDLRGGLGLRVVKKDLRSNNTYIYFWYSVLVEMFWRKMKLLFLGGKCLKIEDLRLGVV
jgi:hypothetical protein